MKFFHLSDLHIGKRVNDFSMLEDQEYILKVILQIIDQEKPDAVIIAGDVYDKSIPSAEAVQLFDDFLVRLSVRKLHTMIISGNHDSPERLSFGSRIMSSGGIHIAPVYSKKIDPVILHDEFGEIYFYLLPFIKPAHVKMQFPDKEIDSYTKALETAIEAIDINPEKRNVLVTHQFVTGALRSDSEDISVGGSDNVDARVFAGFDYVALGHLHRPQKVGKDTIRYSGTPLKYSFSEAGHHKSITMVECLEKENISINEIPLIPKRDMRKIRGQYLKIVAKEFYQDKNTDDYLQITLTDEEEIPEAVGKLRVIYPNIMKLEYDNTRTRKGAAISGFEKMELKKPLDLFAEFYEMQNNQALKKEQRKFLQKMIEDIWEDKV